MSTHHGSCHCGKVAFEIEADIDVVALCDCSICTRKGIVHVRVPARDFRLLQGQDDLTLYRFGSGTAEHWFCRRCGIHSFGRPRTDPGRYTVNARCLDDYESVMAHAQVVNFDGKNHPNDRIP